MENQFVFAKNILFCMAGLPLAFLPNTPEAITTHLFEQEGALGELMATCGTSFVPLRHLKPHTIYQFKLLPGLFCYVIAHYPTKQALLVGPVTHQPYQEETVKRKLYARPLPSTFFAAFSAYMQNVPNIAEEMLWHLMDILATPLQDENIPFARQQVDGLKPSKTERPQPSFLPTEVAKMRQVAVRYENSSALIEAVKCGNLSLAMQCFASFREGRDNISRAKTPLRNTQNYLIILNSLLRHDLESCGIHPFHLDQLSHQFALKIETLTHQSQSILLATDMIQDYCKLVREQAHPHLKLPIKLVVAYVKDHLTDNLTLGETAHALSLNANYLSGLFARKMGMTFTQFVNRERIKQAKGLLLHTDWPVHQIALSVGYNNSSYFAKQFMAMTNTTPLAYRLSAIK